LGDFPGVLAAAEEASAILRDLANDKSDAEIVGEYAISLKELAVMKLKLRDNLGAQAAIEENLTILADIAKKGGPDELESLMQNVFDFAKAKLDAGDRVSAIQLYQSHIKIFRDLAQGKYSANALHWEERLLEYSATAKLKAGDARGALLDRQQRIEVLRELVKDKSNAEINLESQAGLAEAVLNLGELDEQAGHRHRALELYEESLAIARQAAKDKKNIFAQRQLEISLEKVGETKLALGQETSARAAYEEIIANAREFVDNGECCYGMSGRQYLAYALIDYGKYTDDPIVAYSEAAEILEKLRTTDQDLNLDDNGKITWLRSEIARLKRIRGDLPVGEQIEDAALSAARERAKDKNDWNVQRDLIDRLFTLCNVRDEIKDYTGSLAVCEERLALVREAAKNKDNGRAQTYRIETLAKIGSVKWKLKDFSGAFAAYKESLAFAHELAQTFKGNPLAQEWPDIVGQQMAGLAWTLLLERDFSKSLEAVDNIIATEAEQSRLPALINRAHALMFLGRVDEARNIYLSNRGEMVYTDQIWEVAIKEDFAKLRQKGLDHPLMAEIEKTFGAVDRPARNRADVAFALAKSAVVGFSGQGRECNRIAEETAHGS
jgi:hypothetical protein